LGTRQELNERSKALVKREPLTLPKSGVRVVVRRPLMSGDTLKVNALGDDLRGLSIAAFSLEDPQTPGALMFNWNTQEDRDEIAALHPEDLLEIVKIFNADQEMADEEAAKNSEGTGSSSTSSPSVTVSPPQSSETGSPV
jgi:hypothetical protein